jgi:CMP-N,N'-diacetyllegionaminic acid synthase
MLHVVIPARGNSKGIKNKNIIKINGKELIFYTIKISKMVKEASKVVVSTDSKKILKLSKKYGADVPFLRPSIYAKDSSSDLSVFQHYIRWLKKNNLKIPELIVHLRATTPFRSLKIINEAIKIMKKKRYISCLRSMRPSSFNPYKMWYIERVGKSLPIIKDRKELHSTARQKLPKSFDHIGYIDILRVKKTIQKNTITGNHVYPFIIQKKYLNKYIDIDTMDDLIKARRLK